MQLVVVLLPILALLSAILVFRRSIIFAASAALFTLVLSAVCWGMGIPAIAAAGTRGLFLAVEIILILISAILIFELLERHGISRLAREKIHGISLDYRVQTLLIGLGVIYFMEGVAGFGTPAILAVPLFIALGFRPIYAVILTLISDSVPVSFGAVGLPVTYGVGSVLDAIVDDPGKLLDSTAVTVAALNGLGLVFMSLTLLYLTVRMHRGSFKEFTRVAPFAVLSGVIVSLASWLTALLTGAELPSIIGGLVGLVVIAFLAKKKVLLPKTAIPVRVSAEEEQQEQRQKTTQPPVSKKSALLLRAFVPYALLISLLLLTRLPALGIGEWLKGLTLSMQNIFGSGVDYAIAPLYSVAAILLVCAFAALVLFHESLAHSKEVIRATLDVVKRPFVALVIMLVFVQIFILSGNSLTGKAMPVVVAEALSGLAGQGWPLIAPFIGALGAFIAGSATVSNLIFSGLQYDVATNIGAQPSTILSLQTIGAALGNMVALHNIIAALAIARLSEERAHEVIRANAVPLFILLSIMAGVGYVAVLMAK